MNSEILKDVEELVGITEDSEPAFRKELILHINAALNVLSQIGIGDGKEFYIKDGTETWKDFIGEATPNNLHMIKQCVAARVRLAWDTPLSSSVVEVLKEQIKEYEWRLNAAVDNPYTGGNLLNVEG